MDKNDKRNGVFFLIYAFFVLLFTSQNSPLVRYNMYMDPTVYQGIIRGINSGEILYADIFDHKGPFMPIVMSAVNLIIGQSRYTLFFFELVSIWLSIFFAYKTSKLYLSGRKSVLTALIFNCLYFLMPISYFSGCMDEILFGLLVVIFYYWSLYRKLGRLRNYEVIITGVAVGIIFLTKFTLVLEAAVLFGILILSDLFRKHYKKVFKNIGLFLLGFVLPFVPCLIYSGITNSIVDAFEAYISFNIFYAQSNPISGKISIPFDLYAIILVAQIISIYGMKKYVCEKNRNSLLIFCLYLFVQNFFILISGRYYEYCFIVFLPSIIPGIIWILSINEKDISRKLTVAVSAFLLTISIVGNGSIFVLPNWRWCEKTSNEILAEDIVSVCGDNPSILWFRSELGGVIELANTYPQLKYFYTPNISPDIPCQIWDEQIEYIKNGDADILIMNDPEDIKYVGDNYELLGVYDFYCRKGMDTILQMVFVRK